MIRASPNPVDRLGGRAGKCGFPLIRPSHHPNSSIRKSNEMVSACRNLRNSGQSSHYGGGIDINASTQNFSPSPNSSVGKKSCRKPASSCNLRHSGERRKRLGCQIISCPVVDQTPCTDRPVRTQSNIVIQPGGNPDYSIQSARNICLPRIVVSPGHHRSIRPKRYTVISACGKGNCRIGRGKIRRIGLSEIWLRSCRSSCGSSAPTFDRPIRLES